MALSQNTLKMIKRLLKGRLLEIFNPIPPKDINAMLKLILVTTANGKPQTANSRLPFAVNAMLKVSIKKNKLIAHFRDSGKRIFFEHDPGSSIFSVREPSQRLPCAPSLNERAQPKFCSLNLCLVTLSLPLLSWFVYFLITKLARDHTGSRSLFASLLSLTYVVNS